MKRWAWAVVLIVPQLASAAGLDPGVREAYRWQILVRTPKHPVFDAKFRENLARELKAALQPGLGLLGAVEIVDLSNDEKLDEISRKFRTDGWAALESSAVRPLDGIKHHGLSIEPRDGAFVVSARQYDGFSGLATPVLRTRTVRSLEQVPRAAALLLEPDFAAGGTVEWIENDAKHVNLILRAAGLASLEKWVQRGDLFAVAVVKDLPAKEGKGQVASPVPYTFLKAVEPVKDGKVKCLILTRWTSPFGREVRQKAGVRAQRLPTQAATLRVQIVDRAGKPHARSSQLKMTASDIDFNSKAGLTDGFEWRNGMYHSTRPYAGVACIKVALGPDAPQEFPVPVLGDDVITLAFHIDPKAEKRAQFFRECMDLRVRIIDLSTAQEAMFKDMNRMLDEGRSREALPRAEGGRESIAIGERLLAEELNALKQQAGTGDDLAREVLEVCEKSLSVIAGGQKKLEGTIGELKDLIAKSNDPKNLEKDFRGRELKDRIEKLKSQGDIPEALAAFDKLIELYPADAGFKVQRELLQAEWATKDDAHRAARDCIRLLQSAKTIEEFKTACAAIKKSTAVLKARQDRLGLRKLHNSFEGAVGRLHGVIRDLEKTPQTPEGAQHMQGLDDVLTDLRQCETLVKNALQEVSKEVKK